MSPPRKQLHLAAHFPGVNNHTVWSDPLSGSQIAIESFEHLARTAERGKFDYLFLAEGLRLREQRGRIYDLDVVGRPDAITVLAALATVTEHLGLGATVNATFNEPYEVARQFATLELLSGGRSAWNVVTSSDAFTGENFRRGGYLDYADRYERAGEFVRAATELWTSWADDAVVADAAAGLFVRPDGVRQVDVHGRHLDVVGDLGLPRSPQVRPILIQAGDSSDGREFGAATADVIFTRHTSLKAGQAFYADVKGRLAAYGRRAEDLLIMPGATFVLGDTEADAWERARFIRSQQVTAATAIATLEQVWGCDLSQYDADGPLPDIDPDADGGVVQGRVVLHDRLATAAKWRAMAAEKKLTIRQLVMEVGGRFAFVGSASQIAEQLDDHVQQDAADGYILVPHLTPSGLDEFVDHVVPLLQERGVFRHEYTATTLRGHLGLHADLGAVGGASMTGHVLDNVAWHALDGPDGHLAEGSGRARRYRPDVGLFAAVDHHDEASWAELASLAGPGATIVLFRDRVDPAPPGWTELIRAEGHQMVLEERRWHTGDGAEVRPLTDDDVPAMLELIQATRPGPFLARTIELGGYVGVVKGGRLLAMAGERFHPAGWAEVSAVCTHPDAQGKGLGTTVTTHVADAIAARGEQPFLHVARTNDHARLLYERLGFTTRRITEFAALTTPREPRP